MSDVGPGFRGCPATPSPLRERVGVRVKVTDASPSPNLSPSRGRGIIGYWLPEGWKAKKSYHWKAGKYINYL